MTTRLQKLVRVLQLLRLELILSAVSDVWLMMFITWYAGGGGVRPALPGGSLTMALTLGAAAGAGLSIYGLALNDALDARHDRAFSPQRPVAAGAIRQTTAMGIAVLGLLVAVLASVFLGTRPAVLAVSAAVAILFYNIAGKFFPAVGVMLLGLIRAAIMFIPNPGVAFAWPIWLTMTHVTACGAASHVLEGKRPRLRGAEWWGLGAGWAFCTLVLGSWMDWHDAAAPGILHRRPMLWLVPLAAVALFILAAWFTLRQKLRPIRTRRATAGAFASLAALWLILYDAAWLLGGGSYRPAGVLLMLFILAWTAARAVAVLDHIASPPVTYQVKTATGI